MPRKNDRVEAMAEEKREQRKHQEKMAEKQATIQEAFNGDGEMDEEFIREMISNDDLEPGTPQGLQQQTISKIQNLASRDWVLANLTKAQEHNARMKLEVLKLQIYGIHPPEQSHVTGEVRQFLLDDPVEGLEPLTQQERVLIDEFIETLKARFTRGREGFERTQMNTDIARTETDDKQQDNSGGFSLFS